MDVRIGIADSPQVLEIEIAKDTDRQALKKLIDDALVGPSSVLWLQDRKGKDVAVASDRIAYVQINNEEEQRIGFGAGG